MIGKNEMTTTEAGEYLGLSASMVIRLVASGKLPCRFLEERRGRTRLIPFAAVQQLKRERKARERTKSQHERYRTSENQSWRADQDRAARDSDPAECLSEVGSEQANDAG